MKTKQPKFRTFRVYATHRGMASPRETFEGEYTATSVADARKQWRADYREHNGWGAYANKEIRCISLRFETA